MSKVFYRIKNIESGKYFTGSGISVANPNFDEKIASTFQNWEISKSVGKAAVQKYLRFLIKNEGMKDYRERSQYDRSFEFEANEIPPWRRWWTAYWNDMGKLYPHRKGAELVLSNLTKTTKKLRSNKAEFILTAPPEASKYKIIPCKFDIVELSSEDEAKILQSSQENKQEVNK